ncbi:MAG: hypothetical protein FWD15_00155 [Alphaproteobacteria bacterium]|nr:hypothetical protein [Alphaproteobacteria bacterium]
MSGLFSIFKKKNPLDATYAALLSFKGNMATLGKLKDAAMPMFGTDWAPALETYIATTTPPDAAKLMAQLEKAREYDKGQTLWRGAQMLLNGSALPINIESQMEDFEQYLPLFGPDGEVLLEKLKLKFPHPASIGEPNILRKVDLAPTPRPQKSNSKEPVSEYPKTLEINEDVMTDWDIQNFLYLLEFLNLAKHIMPMIVANGAADSLEDYPGYNLILDTYDAAIAKGEKLFDKPEQLLNLNFEHGAKTLREILETLNAERDNEVRVIPKSPEPQAARHVPFLDLDDEGEEEAGPAKKSAARTRKNSLPAKKRKARIEA